MSRNSLSTDGPVETVEQIARRAYQVAAWARGDGNPPSREAWAHAAEDALHQDVLAAIAAGAPNPAELAAAALATTEIKFSRWYE